MGRKRLGRYFDQVRELEPDLIVITGDLMNLEPGYLEELIHPLRRLAAAHRVLAILGNHDFYFGAGAIAAGLRQRTDVQLLRQTSWSAPDLPGLTVLGIDDPRTPPSRPYHYPQLAQLARRRLRSRNFNLLLSHRPDVFPATRDLPVDLILAGHTHGGQVALRLPSGQRWNLTRLRYPYDRGHFRRGRTHLYVNRGLGYVGPPVRINCPPEITRIRLVVPTGPPNGASDRT
jgi:predicted MPP superfamily phosphohydrolase